LDVYNGKLIELNTILNEIGAEERKLEDLNSRMLAGILARFGRDSSEYEAAGGVRASERRNARTGNGANGGAAAPPQQQIQPQPAISIAR
jgi:hypothetical protein